MVDLTEFVNRADDKTASELSELVDAHYPTLRAIARAVLAGAGRRGGIEPTVLVHEAYVRLCDQERVVAAGTLFFKRCFARECRRALIDVIRAERAAFRGGGWKAVTLSGTAAQLGRQWDADLLEVSDAVEELHRIDARMGQLVDLRFFSDLSPQEAADSLGVSISTAERDWRFARAWLKRALGG